MRRRTALVFVLLLILGSTHVEQLAAQNQNPPRLIADNKTAYLVDIYVWTGSSWNFVTRLNARSWTQFPNAAQGSLWRAMIGQVARDHTVQYVWDPSYGGYQSVWWIQ